MSGQTKEARRKYYLEHRKEAIARSKAHQLANKERYREICRLYYYRHREARLEYARTHPQHHRVIKHRGRVILRNVNKPPKPMFCTLCDRKSHLVYHHWEDSKPDIGLWICNTCHSAIHRMIKIGVLEASVKSQNLVTRRAPPK